MELLLATAAAVFAAALSPFVGRHERAGALLLGLVPAGLTLYFLSKVAFIADGGVVTEKHEWVSALGVDFALRLDGLSLLFALLISGIGTAVVFYAGAYMQGHPRIGRFYSILFLFMASMLGMVLADNLMVVFVCWELTSIASFGLISLDSEDETARAAATQALFVTASTGLALLAGFVLLSIATGSQTISEIASGGSLESHSLYLPILILVLVGAFAKSAQVPFYFWLPNAMAAPTPVSAYLHSATMVKAGVYLLARLAPSLGGSDVWVISLMVTGGATMLLGALFALRETDLKRMLAYSTVGTLGMLVLLIGADTQEAMLAAMALLLAHAMYKATLFLNAGIIDRETGTRDVERLSGLAESMPVTAATTTLAAASMAGVVVLFGFIAKESVYEAVQDLPHYAVIATIAVVCAGILQVVLALRLVLVPFFGRTEFLQPPIHESGLRMLAGPIALTALGVLLGLFPGIVDGEILGPAANAATSVEAAASLSIWHGLTLTLLLSVLTLASGAVAYTRLPALKRTLDSAAKWRRFSPESIYTFLLDELPGAADRQTRLLQHGYLRLYMTAVVVAATVLVGGTMVLRNGFDFPDTTSPARVYEVTIALFVFAGALMAVLARTRIVAAIALGAVGYGIALLYMLFGAPDLAMTQILVETLVVLLFVFAFYRLPRFANYTTATQRLRDMAISIAAGATVMGLMLTMLSVEREPSVSNAMAEVSKPLGHGSNVVNVILVDIRALDTMGEISVLLVAAVGVLALLRLSSKQEGQ